MDAKQTPLIDLLVKVPVDARLIVTNDKHSSSAIPVGRLCQEAANALRAELAKQKLDPTGSELPNKQANQQDLTSQGQVPAWHDAPTCDGLWLNSCDGHASVIDDNERALKNAGMAAGRWYGPIPQEGKKS